MWLCVKLKRVSLIENKTCSTQGHGTNDISLESCVRSQGNAAVERMLAPIEETQANPWQKS